MRRGVAGRFSCPALAFGSLLTFFGLPPSGVLQTRVLNQGPQPTRDGRTLFHSREAVNGCLLPFSTCYLWRIRLLLRTRYTPKESCVGSAVAEIDGGNMNSHNWFREYSWGGRQSPRPSRPAQSETGLYVRALSGVAAKNTSRPLRRDRLSSACQGS